MRTVHIASVSGGKDSTAMCLWLQEQGIEYRAVHFNTGWEHPDTVAFVRDVLPQYVGPIESHSREPELDEQRETYAQELERLLGFRSPFVRWVLRKGMFPARLKRFCTTELKIYTARDVMQAAHAAGELPVNVIGIRAAESAARAQLPEREISTTLDCMVWRPLIRWSEQDVIDIHKRHGVPPNPLYLRGSNRVGCWPCIMAGKSEIKRLEEERLHIIERLEHLTGILAQQRADESGKPLIVKPYLFQLGTRNEEGKRPPTPIRKMVEWSHTHRGGKERDNQPMFPGLNEGCLRWGMCET